MEKPMLKGLGRVLVVEADADRAEARRQEILGPTDEEGKYVNGNEVEIVQFKFEAAIKLADSKYRTRFKHVLLDGSRMLYPDLAMDAICDDPDLFGG